jgi:hypothetical protein
MPHYSGYLLPPEEGELHRRFRYSRKNVPFEQVWSVNIDKSKGGMTPGLRLLWDT